MFSNLNASVYVSTHPHIGVNVQGNTYIGKSSTSHG